jgi:DNA helicase-2/ATP-dependent DNA helicase PcrA
MTQDLNYMQKIAVDINEGPVLVSAPPGSGKSRIIVHRVAKLIDSQSSPDKIMVATFTRKAATELKERVSKMVGSDVKKIACGTFHSICLDLLKRFSDKDWQVISENEARNILSSELTKEGIDVKTKDLLLDISYLKAWMISPQEAMLKAKTPLDKKLAEIYFRYEQTLKENKYLDFDNIIIETLRLLNNEKYCKYAQGMFDHVLVDEYQDVNKLQGVLLNTIAQKSKSIFAVGDESQAIYGFMGANLNEFRTFPKRYAGCKPIVLDLNYRSNKSIIDVSNSVIASRTSRLMRPASCTAGEKVKICISDSVEAEADKVQQIVSSLDGTTAILVRAAWQLYPILKVLDRAKIIYRVLNDSSRSIEEDLENYGVKVYVLTIHAAKGLEFDNVIVVGLEENVLPYKDATDIEEERRLFYVAITRAKEKLFISACSNRNGRISQISRFMSEIPRNLIEKV